MSQFQFTRFNILPPVIKNIIIINVLMYLTQQVWPEWTTTNLALFYFDSPLFKPVQLITHMFMHGSVAHIFFNMFALWMFGAVLENVWGPQRFLAFYFLTGFGAVLLHQAVLALQLHSLTGSIYVPETTANLTQEDVVRISGIAFNPVMGASGAIFGVLVAFGMLFPNTLLYIYFLFPIKAKYFIIIYIAIELYMGFLNSPGDNVAHFAHIGGGLFGFLMVLYWRRKSGKFY